ncbi:proton-conducting transporter membrane subunit [Thermogladius sp.]|uniref:proton-conducting transporter transmembrane domain-containing protein n=1 Tax=Thermogladius sp. TaxID=2023064 RepID=UPI003D0F2A5A
MKSLVGLVPLTTVLGAFTTPVVYLATKSRRATFAYATLFSLSALVLSLAVAVEVYAGKEVVVYNAGGWPGPVGIVYVVDGVNALLALVTAFLSFLIFVYSYEYVRDSGYPWYLVMLLGAETGLLGVIYTGDVFNLFVMIEVTAISSYGLVMYYRWRATSIVSGLKYAFIGALGTTGFLLALAIVYAVFGSLNLVDIGLKAMGYPGSAVTGGPLEDAALAVGLVLALSLWAFTIKSGVFPNHFWLPDAHPAAPTPVSALLSGLVVNAGAVSLYKVLYLGFSASQLPGVRVVVESVSLIALVTGLASSFLGGLLMAVQADVKRLIAYSTVMNMGFVFMSIATLSPIGVLGFVYYTVVHSLAKATLFLSVGPVIRAAASRRLDRIAGLGRIIAPSGVALAVSTLTLAGIPPLPGFLGKLLIYQALFQYNVAAAVLFVVSSAVGLVSYMRLFYVLLVSPPTQTPAPVHAPLMKSVLAVLSAVLVAAGLVFTFSRPAFDYVFYEPVKAVGDVASYLKSLSTSLYGLPG